MGTFAGLVLPWWDIELSGRRPPHGRSAAAARQPRVLVHAADRTERVCRCCPLAQRAGIVPGMPLGEAQALAANLVAAPLDIARSRRGLLRLARWCRRFAPRVALDPETAEQHPPFTADGLLLDISGTAHLFGGEMAFLQLLTAEIRALGFHARLAAAPTIGSAWAMARFGGRCPCALQPADLPHALDGLPPLALRLPGAIQQALEEVGVRTIGQLRQLDRGELTHRFGRQVVLRMQQALGLVPEPLVAMAPSEHFRVIRTTDGPIATRELLLPLLTEMLDVLLGRLSLQGRGLRGLRLVLRCEHAAPVECSIQLVCPTRRCRHILHLLETRLETLCTEAPVQEVELTATHTQPLPHAQHTLWLTDEADMQAAAGETNDLLENRLGSNHVYRRGAAASHMPEKAAVMAPLQEAPTAAPAPAWRRALLRPSFLLPVPEPVQVIALQPENPPSRVEWRGVQHAIARGLGPERMVTEWWHTGISRTRDYYLVQNQMGCWMWVFRVMETGRWFMQGVWS